MSDALNEEVEVDYHTKHLEPYFHNPKPGFTDFCRRLVPPNTDMDMPEGCVIIAVDDDFWSEARLPWSYHEKTIGEIVAELWPDIEDPVLRPDADDPWWDEYWAEVENRANSVKD